MKVYKIFIFFLLFLPFRNLAQKPKIVGLVPMRNESLVIEQCLRCLSLYTDAIVVFDDASEDNTVEIVEALAEECNVERIIKKKVWKRDEASDKSLLLNAGREIGGTHFIFLDADEMFTANCLKNNFLRKKILALQPGDSVRMPWIQLWGGTDTYRIDDGITFKVFIFCDEEACGIKNEKKKFIHIKRVPENLSGKEEHIKTHGVLHFQSINIKNMAIRESWYRCIERVRHSEAEMPTEIINKRYKYMTNESGLQLETVPRSWYKGYDFFDASAYEKLDLWKRDQIYKWFDEYGFEFFADLDLPGLSENFGDEK